MNTSYRELSAKEIIKEYYLLALLDIVNGASINELKDTIKLYENNEEYEACAGILKALEISKSLTLREIKNIIKKGDKSNTRIS